MASFCDILLVYNEGLGCRRGDLSLLTFFGDSITGQSKNNGLIYEPLAGKFAIFWRRNMTFSLCHFSSPLNLVVLSHSCRPKVLSTSQSQYLSSQNPIWRQQLKIFRNVGEKFSNRCQKHPLFILK